ncbi:pectin lyase fold/virulence factor [Mycena sp. CBHHK59/15]|nr:pectin lyase fold/virulence factor [Mycena sp. CBHHK59/15]
MNCTDDSPAIVEVFSLCGQGGRIEFLNETYWIEKVMNTTGLNDAVIDLRGTLLWSTANISYWLNNSLPIGFQNQTSAWFLGGNNILFDGHSYGTFNCNGQIWYDFTKGVSNLAGRPHALTIWNTHNSTFTGIRFVQSQMWTMTILASSYVDMLDIFVSSTSNDSVHNGDNSIAMKRNSSDVLIEDSVFYIGTGIAIGSTGQFPGEYEAIEQVLTRNCSFIGTRFVGYIKTWTGVAEITQCTSFSGAVGQCDTSTMQISNITWSGLQGSLLTSSVVSLECSGAAPCQDLRILDSDFTFATNTTVGTYSCHAVASTEGFTCQ